MRKTERELRNWANHLAMQLRRRGTGYSVSRLYSDVPISGLERRIDFRTLSQVEPWLRKWMDDELVRLGRSGNPRNGTG